MPRQSAGLLLHRERKGQLEVMLVHPGGPFWARKDDGAWSIPKGEFEEGEEPLAAAKREFLEELGSLPEGEPMVLGTVRQPGGKMVHAWSMSADFDPSTLRSNVFEVEWPRGSGRRQEFPEVDRAEWFPMALARRKILVGQRPLLDQLERLLEGPGDSA